MYDANRVVATFLSEHHAIHRAYENADRIVPPSMRAFIRNGERGLETLREAMDYVLAANMKQGLLEDGVAKDFVDGQQFGNGGSAGAISGKRRRW